jgi:hypothetical protein
MSEWGTTVLVDEMGETYWLSREAVPNMAQARRMIAEEIGLDDEETAGLPLKETFMRPASEVELKIGGHEDGYMVECTTRAKRHEAYWKCELG